MKKKVKKLDKPVEAEKPIEKPLEVEKKKPVDIPKRPTIEELEAILNSEEEQAIEILPNGEVRAIDTKAKPKKKPLTLRENLGGEYAVA